MPITKITTTTEAFDLSKVEIGHLIIVLDQQHQLVGTGVIIGVHTWEIKCGLYTGETSWSEDSLEGMAVWRVNIEQVINREFNLIVLNPVEYLP